MTRRHFALSLSSSLTLCLGISAPLMVGCIAAETADFEETDAVLAEDLAQGDLADEQADAQADEQVRQDRESTLVGGKFRRAARPVARQYMVTLSSRAQGDARGLSARLANAHRGDVRHVFGTAVRGFVAQMSEQDALQMAADPDVELVEEDGFVSINTVQSSVAWGLDRIDSRALNLNSKYVYDATGSGVHAYIIDTGVRQTHSEFSGRIGGGYDAVTSGGAADDCNGHGTHVAGIVGGTTYGVAKGVTLHPVRVLNCSGSGTTSQVVAGVDWVAANFVGPAVANLSLGGSASTTLDNALQDLIDAGVTVVVAAGNDGASACSYSPARLSDAITVGATTSTDARASYSNYGSCLDLFAPGSSITSAYIGSDSATTSMSGTSMASPHVAGAVALYLQDHPSASPSSVASLVRNAAAQNVVGDEGSGSPDKLLNIGFNPVTIQASSGHYFVAEGGGGDDVDANRTSAGIWEKFNLVDINGGTLESGDYVFLQAYYGKFMVAEGGGGSTVEADRSDPAAWETFRIWKQNGSGSLASGDTIALQASNGKYVCAEGGGNGEVNANRSAIGAWEKLTLTFIEW